MKKENKMNSFSRKLFLVLMILFMIFTMIGVFVPNPSAVSQEEAATETSE